MLTARAAPWDTISAEAFRSWMRLMMSLRLLLLLRAVSALLSSVEAQ